MEAGLRVVRRDGPALASVMARAGQGGALRARMKERFGLDLPDGPRRAEAGSVTAVGMAPGAWLIVAEASETVAFAEELALALDGVAAVADQSGAYEVLRLGGEALRTVLAKGVALDFHASAFGPDAAAVTLADHVGVILWRVDAGDALTLDIAVPRSFFRSFWSWLTESAASVGLALDGASARPPPNPQFSILPSETP
jgi:methylglutamate dehydrogenase subunit D